MITLVEYFINHDIELETLSEGVLKRFFMGTDREALVQLKAAAKKKTISKAKKRKLLAEIDDSIDNSNRVFTPSNFKHALGELGLNAVFGGMPLLVKVFTRMLSSGDRHAYRESLYTLRGIIKSMPVSKDDEDE